MKRYEVVYIAFHDVPGEDIDNQLERYLSIVADYKGTVVRVDRWGKRRLAYPIQKRREGYYVLIDFVGDSSIIPEMERRLRIDDKILRFISVKKQDKVDLEEIEREIAAIREAEASRDVPVSEAAPEPADRVQEEEKPSGEPEAEPVGEDEAEAPAEPAQGSAETGSEDDVEMKEN